MSTRVYRPFGLSFAAGCATALLVLECLLHAFAGKSASAAGTKQRWYREGLATSHFSPNGLRLTGNAPVAGAPAVLVLGDSKVEALQVSDRETMGSVLERRLRTSGRPWNVQEYGWSGANGPDFVFAASWIDRTFHPQTVFIVVDARDFVLTTAVARLREDADGVTAEPIGPGARPGRPAESGGSLLRRLKTSGLLYASAMRLILDVLPRLRPAEPGGRADADASQSASDRVVDLVLHALVQAYGNKLVMVYAPDQPFSQTPPEPDEGSLSVACARAHAACLDLRQAMMADLEGRHELTRGFTNTPPGLGHLNAAGHELAAGAMYDWLAAHRP